VISEKNILQPDFEGKYYCKEIPGEKNYYTVKKNLSRRLIKLEKSLSPLFFRKKFYHQRFGEKMGRTGC